MPLPPPPAVTLACHPETPTDAVRAIAARVSRRPDGGLAVTWRIEGDIERLRVPPQRSPRPADRLWEHTCCEIFIAVKGVPGYDELNVSPSGEWAAYGFEGYRAPRAGAPGSTLPAPRVSVSAAAGSLELDAVIGLEPLLARHRAAPLALALAAVIEDLRGGLSYWALRHPGGRPDFHHPDAFALELEGMPA